jgi:hypothetical protein
LTDKKISLIGRDSNFVDYTKWLKLSFDKPIATLEANMATLNSLGYKAN